MGFGQPSVKGRALAHLARREHSRVELERKLARRVEDAPEATAAEQIAKALDELGAHGLQSDARAAESVLHTQAPRFGARRLQQNLRAKGLSDELVASTLAQARGSEFERALSLWQRRFGSIASDPKAQARQMRFLAGRGFTGDVIQRVLRSARDGRAEDTDLADGEGLGDDGLSCEELDD